MYEDIDQWLINYRDSESIIKLVNMLVTQGLGMRKVFGLEGKKLKMVEREG